MMSAVLEEAGRLGLGSAGAAASSAAASGMAARVRDWAATLAADIESVRTELQAIDAVTTTFENIYWVSQAREAFFSALALERASNQEACSSAEFSAQSTLLAGEAVAQQLEGLAAALGASGAAVDSLLGALGSIDIEDIAKDLPRHASELGIFGAQGELDALMQSPLLPQVGSALASVGR
ncbi:MAG: hypothetical protein Q3965_01115 [Rothia sp. (in: high G+C Gram-positive bacteria)]|nr:hypothetical protein [Rothia sp. (in: high G+C Gram-positive bacteria)]